MESSSSSSSLLPYDVALLTVSFLEARDVCSLGCCSRFWRDLCASDCVWTALYERRWPSDDRGLLSSLQQGPRSVYISKHQKMAVAISAIIEFVKQLAQEGSLEVDCYLKSVNDLGTIGLGFEDLNIQRDDLMSVLRGSKVAERHVCVSWFKVGRWFYGFRLHDEHHSRTLSLGDLAMGKEEDVMNLLNRGSVHGVLRVHITSAASSR